MLPFVCRNIRNLSSTLKFSAKVARKSLNGQTRGMCGRARCLADLSDRSSWMTCRIEDALNKSETRVFSTFPSNLTSVCSLAILLADGSNAVSVEGGGDDDDVTTSAGKKRKHWKICVQKG